MFFSACWSGYWDDDPFARYDAPAVREDVTHANEFRQCTIGGVNPRTDLSDIPCPPPPTVPGAAPGDGDDQASNLAFSGASTTNQVTIYACFEWEPPFVSGFTGGPITMRAVITEAMQHQQ